jgi:hypothetical protein
MSCIQEVKKVPIIILLATWPSILNAMVPYCLMFLLHFFFAQPYIEMYLEYIEYK